LLLVEAASDGTDPAADRLNRWANGLHDRLASQGRPTAADRQQLTSWLRVQAVGRDTVTVSEPRVGTYAGLWAAAARAAGLPTRLRSADGTEQRPTPDEAAMEPAFPSVPAPALDDRWQTRARVWLLDRAEAAGRIVIRAAQR
jgi:hypothetical protein